MPQGLFHPAPGQPGQQRHAQQRGRAGGHGLKAHRPAEQHEDRPVPQVQRIGQAADRHHRRGRQRAADPAPWRALQQTKQAQRAQHRPKPVDPGRMARTRGPQPIPQCANAEQQQRRAPADAARRCRQRREPAAERQHLEQQHASAQLPEPRGGQIERIDLMAALARTEHRIPQRCRDRHAEQPQRYPAPAWAFGPGQEQQREQQVELLFHAQRPGVRVRVEFGAR